MDKHQEDREMLILKRRAGESLKIDGGIEVIVLGVQGSQVKIGIKAPDSVGVYRDELYDRMTKAGKKIKKLAAVDVEKETEAESETAA
jgi:carbon storage regulator